MKQFILPASADDINLSVAVIEPEGKPKGVFQLVHGMCEHKERYFDFMEYLAAHGFVAVIHDHRGHGASVKCEDDLGYFGKGGWRAMVDDVKVVGDWARKEYPGLPFTLFGHSMGSMVVRSYAKRYDSGIDRLFVSGCPVDNPARIAGAAVAWLCGTIAGWHSRPKFLALMTFAGYNKGFEDEGFSRAWVCSNHEVLQKYHDDPLCRFTFTSNGFYNLLKLMGDCYTLKGWSQAHPELPVRFLSGGDDPCRGSDKALEGAADKMRKAGYSDVSVRIYPHMRHEILNEIGREKVWKDILSEL